MAELRPKRKNPKVELQFFESDNVGLGSDNVGFGSDNVGLGPDNVGKASDNVGPPPGV